MPPQADETEPDKIGCETVSDESGGESEWEGFSDHEMDSAEIMDKSSPDPTGLATLPDHEMSASERCQKMLEAHDLIRANYHAGVPLFIKEMFRYVVEQITRYENGDNDNEKLSVTGLDGVVVWFPLGPRIEPLSDDDSLSGDESDDGICVLRKPCVEYRSFEMLTDPSHGSQFSRGSAFLPIEISSQTELFDTETNEPLEDDDFDSDVWPSFDHETACTRFENARRHWDASELFAQVKSTLRSARLPPRISKIVALACSNMASFAEPGKEQDSLVGPDWGTLEWEPPAADDPVWGKQPETESRSLAQHALILALREVFASAAGQENELFAQDPDYKPSDKRILREAGITVLEDPKAFLEVEETSVVFSSCPGVPVREIIADIALPAVLIWNKVEGVMDHDVAIRLFDPVSTRVKDMMEEYDEYEFPRDDKCFREELAIYV